MILLLLVFDLLSCANGDTFSLVVPDGVLSGQLGSSVVLPCTVSPALDCTSYEVRWYRLKDKDNPILLYKDLKVQENSGDPRYRDRVSQVGELGKGDVSLKLEKLTLADRGEYVCYVNSDQWYEEASVFLNLSGRIFPKRSQKNSASTGPLEEEGRPLVADLSPPSGPVCAVREINKPDGETQTSADLSPPSGPVCAVREINRTDGETQTSVEFKPPPSSDGATQTSGPETANKETNTEITDWEMMLEHKVAIKPGPSDAKGVLFKERMRSGQYFWIVRGLHSQTTQSLNNTNQNPTLWYVGVTNQIVLREPNLPLTPQNGYWVLQYDKDKGYYVNDSSQTQTVPVRDQFPALGVFLDCEKHTLSFYDFMSKFHLYTFYNVPSSPTSPLIPVIYPGLKPKYKLEICQFNCVNCDELYR